MSPHSSDWEASPESIERLLAIHGWNDALYRAYKRDTVKLAAYLRSDLPLDQDKREALADLIDRFIHIRTGAKGPKGGRTPPRNPDEVTEDYVVALARPKVDRMRQRNGGKAPPGAYRQAILLTCRMLGDDGYNVEIDVDKALAKMRRGRRRHRT
jgi:hypothetical protein